jgi:hypothetical protein
MGDTMLPVTDFTHIVGNVQHLLDALHVKIPSALCGASLADPNILGYDSPKGDSGFSPCTLTTVAVATCPACAQAAGWRWCSVHGDYEPDDPCSDIPEEF